MGIAGTIKPVIEADENRKSSDLLPDTPNYIIGGSRDRFCGCHVNPICQHCMVRFLTVFTNRWKHAFCVHRLLSPVSKINYQHAERAISTLKSCKLKISFSALSGISPALNRARASKKDQDRG